MTALVVSRPSSVLTERGQFRPRVIAARLLTAASRRLLRPEPWGPSPCCGRGEFLVPYINVPGVLLCTRDGRAYTDTDQGS